ncbi:MAG: Eco57I restriction-modification methylase domain-containing protein, partial [Methanobacteriaceae archaeon]
MEYECNIDDLDKKLKNIKILDPACGSGAFLNKAADILLDIHRAVHQKKYQDDNTLDYLFDDINSRRTILLNNIYGVDINEESIDITKLSLFLKVCKKGLKLPNLDDNIKCGNSLIDDVEFDNKAFDWKTQFKEVFDIGGFDIIIGNPPWGASFSEIEKKYIKNSYNEIEYQFNSYVVFLEKCNYILKNSGYFGYIIPSSWIYMTYFKNIRKFLVLNNTFDKFIHLKYHAFEEVISESSIICYKKENCLKTHKIKVKSVKDVDEFFNKDYINISQYKLEKSYENGFLISDSENSFYDRIIEDNGKLGNLCNFSTGIKPYQRNKGIPKQTKEDVNNKIYSTNYKINEDYEPYLVGGNINPYRIQYPDNQWLKYGKYLAEPRDTFNFKQRKIVIRRTSNDIFASIDDSNFINLNSVHNIVSKDTSEFYLEYIACLLNSNLMNEIYKYLVPDGKRVFSEVKIVNLKRLPIPQASKKQQETFKEMVNNIISHNTKIQDEINKFNKWLLRRTNINKVSKKLEKYHDLDFDEFLIELKKKKVDIKPRKTQELFEKEFN